MLREEDFENLKEGINDLAKTASQLSELNKVALSGAKLGEKLAAAEAAVRLLTAIALLPLLSQTAMLK